MFVYGIHDIAHDAQCGDLKSSLTVFEEDAPREKLFLRLAILLLSTLQLGPEGNSWKKSWPECAMCKVFLVDVFEQGIDFCSLQSY